MAEEKLERFKQIVDSIFDKLEDTENKIKERKVPTGPIRKRLDEKKAASELDKEIVVDPDAPQNEVVDLALDELEMVRQAFLTFQEQTEDLAIYQFIYPAVEEFVEFCLDLVELVEDDFDVENLHGKSLEQYQKIQKLRARILSAMYMKYKKKD
jgi:hypothetical protein